MKRLVLLLALFSVAVDVPTNDEVQKVLLWSQGAIKGDVTGDGIVNESDLAWVKSKIPVAPTVTPTTVTASMILTPSMDCTTLINDIHNPSVFLLRDGIYTRPQGKGQNWWSVLHVARDGVTVKAYPGENPVIDATSMYYGVCIGLKPDDHIGSPVVNGVTIDGLRIKMSGRAGVFLIRATNCTVKNCIVSEAGQYGSEEIGAGVGFGGVCDSCTINSNRIYGCGCGIGSLEDAATNEPHSITRCSITDNFCYGNYPPAGNPANGGGLDLHFPERCVIEGNICYDNPDGGCNGLAFMRCTIRSNAFIDNWNGNGGSTGNVGGLKMGVRGGGGNVIIGNLMALNGSTGYEQDYAPGDLVINNTVYSNGSPGLNWQAMEGMSINNILINNGMKSGDNVEFKGIDADESGYNLYTGALSLQRPFLRTHERVIDAQLATPTLPNHPHTDVKQVIHPEQIWGVGTTSQVRAILATRFKPTNAAALGTALTQTDILTIVNSSIYQSRVQASLNTAIASPNHPQGPSTYKRVQNMLLTDHGYGTLSIKDINGQSISNIGCVQ